MVKDFKLGESFQLGRIKLKSVLLKLINDDVSCFKNKNNG